MKSVWKPENVHLSFVQSLQGMCTFDFYLNFFVAYLKFIENILNLLGHNFAVLEPTALKSSIGSNKPFWFLYFYKKLEFAYFWEFNIANGLNIMRSTDFNQHITFFPQLKPLSPSSWLSNLHRRLFLWTSLSIFCSKSPIFAKKAFICILGNFTKTSQLW